jgi:hypothetical protein
MGPWFLLVTHVLAWQGHRWDVRTPVRNQMIYTQEGNIQTNTHNVITSLGNPFPRVGLPLSTQGITYPREHCVCVCVYTQAHVPGSACTHRERSQPLPYSLGEGSGGQRGWGIIGFGVSYLHCWGSFLCFIYSLINP